MDISKILPTINLHPQDGTPLYVQIANAISELIQTESLKAGTKLPPERELAAQFGVSRTTAINTYHLLEKKGAVEIRVGSGTYVARQLPAPLLPTGMPWSQLLLPTLPTPTVSILKELVSNTLAEGTISLAAGMPDPAFYPTAIFQELLAQYSGTLKNQDLGYIPTEGYPSLRISLAAWMRDKGLPATPENTMIVSGSQQGLYLLSKIFLSPGDYVITQSPTYLGAIQIFQATGARILSFPATQPLPLDILEDYLIRYRPKLMYLLPTFQNPTGHVLSRGEREQLLQLAARHRLVIVEDDAYGEIYYSEPPPPALKTLDNYGGVVYLSTFSKTLLPGLRTGWLVAHETVINRLAMEKQYIDLHSSNLNQIMLHLYLQNRLLPDHLSTLRTEYKNRRDAAVKAVRRYCGGMLSFNSPDGGFYLWCKISQPLTARALLHETSKLGVSFVPGETFYAEPAGEDEFRLCFATHQEEIITEGIKRIAKCLAAGKKNIAAKTQPGIWQPII